MPICCMACCTNYRHQSVICQVFILHIWQVLVILSSHRCQSWNIFSRELNHSRGLPPTNLHLPITRTILQKLWAVWSLQPKNPDYIMLWAARTTRLLGGLLRSREVTSPKHQFDDRAHLAFGDVTLDSRSSSKLVQPVWG